MVLIVGFAWAYDEIRSLHGNIAAEGVRHGRQLLRLDRDLHLNWSASMNHWLSHHDAVADVLSGYYVVMHLGMVALTLVILWIHGPRYRYHRNVLIFLSVVGFAAYWLYPAAPPRLLGTGYHDTVAVHLPFAYHVEAASANLYAAFPSLHVAWALWAAVALWSISTRWWLRALEALHPVITAITVLATGNHYAVDVLAGALLTAIGYLAYDAALALVHRGWAGTGRLPARQRTAGS
ncbi:MAG TPA: phosphatase PAP2 family protein [Mycobacteriales bacterium]|nr:phosphatase PAP2 family protein [Mycobacteriales bacterium]